MNISDTTLFFKSSDLILLLFLASKRRAVTLHVGNPIVISCLEAYVTTPWGHLSKGGFFLPANP